MVYTRTDGDYLYDIDVNMMAEGINGNGVVTGCAITASGSPDWITHVAAGTMRVGGVNATVGAQDKTHDTPTSTNVRWDLLEVGANGTVDIVKGTEVAAGGTPLKPNNSASHIIIAHVYIDGSVGNIPTGSIFDARFMLPTVLLTGTATVSTGTISVTYSRAFPATPSVIISAANSSGRALEVTITASTAAGFDANVNYVASTGTTGAGSAHTHPATWNAQAGTGTNNMSSDSDSPYIHSGANSYDVPVSVTNESSHTHAISLSAAANGTVLTWLACYT